MSSGPLSHVRVLDLTDFLAGPHATQILGDLGADIIKVEPPGGDSSRHVAPYFVAGSSTYYTQNNRNKRSIVIDLKTGAGLALVKELARHCDILMENRRPGVMARLGLDFDELALANPGLIWCSISGFGQDGPARDRAAYDMIVQAMSGTMSLTGEKGGTPVRAGVPMGDIGAGMFGVIGVLAALAQRDRTGRGDFVDIAMFDVQISLLNYLAAAYLYSGKVPGPQGRDHDYLPGYRCIAAADGIMVAIGAISEKMWQNLFDVLGVVELLADPRFTDPDERQRNRDELTPLLEAAFGKWNADDLVAALTEKGVPAAPVNTVDRALAERQVAHRQMVLDLRGAAPEQRARVAGDPVKIRHGHRREHGFPPCLGEHSREILSEILGYDRDRIDGLIDSGVVA